MVMTPDKSQAWDGQTLPKDIIMFYYIAPNGFPTAFESFDAFLETLQKHAIAVNERTVYRVTVPTKGDFHCNDYREGFDGRPLKIWTKGGLLIGYEF